MHVIQAISFQRLVWLIAEVFGVTISQGAIANILARAQAPLVGAAQPWPDAVSPQWISNADALRVLIVENEDMVREIPAASHDYSGLSLLIAARDVEALTRLSNAAEAVEIR